MTDFLLVAGGITALCVVCGVMALYLYFGDK